MHGGFGADQEVVADDRSTVEPARLHAERAGKQAIRAEEQSEVTDVELDDRKPSSPSQGE
jgi:hypothetical protein